MISASTQPDFDTLAAALEAMAAALAEAHARDVADARAGNPQSWRDAGRVWPLFDASMKKG